MRWAVVLNRRSGTAAEPEALQLAFAKHGLAADLYEVPAVMGGPAADQIARDYDVLVAAGGDGTASTVAAAAAAAGRTFGLVPSGTFNHFARDTGIPSTLDEAVAVLAAGRTRLLDIGDVNGHIFINNASLGAYPRMVWERNRARAAGLPRWAAGAVAVTRTWLGLRSMAVRVTVDGTPYVRRTPFIFVGNSEYEVAGTDLGKRPSMTDGTLSLYMAPRFGRADALLLPARVLLKTLEKHERFEAFSAAAISIETARTKVSVGLDGEVRMIEAPLQFHVRRNALRAILP